MLTPFHALVALYFRRYLRLIFIILTPLLWVLLMHPWNDRLSLFAPLENWALDLRYRYRGEITAPIKIFYVNVDSKALAMMGEPPWNLDYFADIAQIAIKVGKAKAVGFDFVFSGQSLSSHLIDKIKARDGAIHLGGVVLNWPTQIVLGAEYTGVHLEYLQDGNISRWGHFPLIMHGNYDPAINPYPEVPHYPIIGPNWGRIGLINDNPLLEDGTSVKLWPMFSEFKGGSNSLAILMGMRDINGLPLDSIQLKDDYWVLHDLDGSEISRLPSITQRTFYTLSLELFLAYHGLSDSAVKHDDKALTVFDAEGALLATVPLTHKQLVPVNWFSRWDNPTANATTSVVDLYQALHDYEAGSGRNYEAARAFFKSMENTVVIVGPTDDSFDDLIITPFDSVPVPKVSIHGNLLKMYASESYLEYLSPWVQAGITLIFAWSLAIFSWVLRSRGHWVKAVIFVCFLSYILVSFYVFKGFGVVLPMVLPVAAAVSVTLISLLLRSMHEEREKNRIQNLFQNYVSPKVVQQIVDRAEDPCLGGADVCITSFFSDIQHFSHFSEKLIPAELVRLMNEYFEAMTLVIQAEGGTLDKYIGDAVVAMFGAPLTEPDHALRACMAAIRVQKRQEELNAMWSSQGKRWPQGVHHMITRIGLNTGRAIVGNMGSLKRFNYTMMGGTVNLASRAELVAKVYGASIVATSSTVEAALLKGDFIVYRQLDTLMLPGITKPTTAIEVMGFGQELPASAFECANLYEAGLEAYEEQNWAKAIKLFEASLKLEPHKINKSRGIQHNPSSVLLKRMQAYQSNPPCGKHWIMA